MPLDPVSLQSGLEAVAADPPATVAACAQAWADAAQVHAAAVVPGSTTVTAAAATLSTALAAAFDLDDAAPAMETAFAAFAATIGGGMTGFVATPPPGAVGFAAQFAGPKPSTHAAAAAAVGTLIDTWMRTGTATPSGGGSTVNWS